MATPGRFWELQKQGQAFLQNLSTVKFLVIDEADRMAQKGHFEELDQILTAIGQCQKFIFSATLTLTHKGSERMARKDVTPQTQQEKLNKLMKTIGMLHLAISKSHNPNRSFDPFFKSRTPYEHGDFQK